MVPTDRAPSSRSSAATPSARSAKWSTTWTAAAPSRANRSAVARPMPLPPPVIRITLPVCRSAATFLLENRFFSDYALAVRQSQIANKLEQSVEQAEAFRRCYRIRRVEEILPELKARGDVQGSLHLCTGQEAIPVGACAQLTADDRIVCTYRGHGWVIARGVPLAEFFSRADGPRLAAERRPRGFGVPVGDRLRHPRRELHRRRRRAHRGSARRSSRTTPATVP